jgi:hypothetical protein
LSLAGVKGAASAGAHTSASTMAKLLVFCIDGGV